MLLAASNPTFVLYALTTVALVLLLLVLWAYSGFVRGKTGTAMNPEDGRRFGADVVAHDPPEVARVLRAHANAQASIVPFLLLGLLFVALGGGARTGAALFGTFVAARLAHAVVYLAGKQPWRTLCFIAGGVATGVLLVDTLRLLWAGAHG